MVLRMSVVLMVVVNLLLNYVSVKATGSTEGSAANKASDFSGIYVPVMTSFENNSCGIINVEVIPHYAKMLASKGVDGVLVGGPAGEGPSLTAEERKTLIKVWAEAGKSCGLKVLAFVTVASTPETFELARYAEEQAVDAIVVTPFSFYKPMTIQKGVSDMKLIADCAQNTPIIYYDTVKSGVKLNMYEFFPLAAEAIPTFSGLICDLETALQITSVLTIKPNQCLMISKHISTRATFALDFPASISAAYNICPELAVGIKNAKDRYVAASLQTRMNKIVASLATPRYYIADFKAAVGIIYDIQLGSTRAPVYETTYERRRNHTIWLREMGIPLKKPVV